MGERELIRAIQAAIVQRDERIVRWSGDDAAVVRARPLAVTSIDTVVDGVHFSLATHAPADIGWKALATALSDLAAMGAQPGEAYVSLVLPPAFNAGLGTRLRSRASTRSSRARATRSTAACIRGCGER